MEGRGLGRRDGRRQAMPGRSTGPGMPMPAACLRTNAADSPRPADHARPPARARCGKAARRDLCGGQGAIPVPTATKTGSETANSPFCLLSGSIREKWAQSALVPGLDRFPNRLGWSPGDLVGRRRPWIATSPSARARVLAMTAPLHMLDRQHARRGLQRAGDRRADGVAAGQADLDLLLRPEDDDERHLAFAGRA